MTPAERFWTAKLEEARAGHRAEREKMRGHSGASFLALERWSNKIRKAEAELAKARKKGVR